MCNNWIKEKCSSLLAAVNSLVERHPNISRVALAIAVLGFATYLAAKYGIALFFAFLSIAFATFFASRSLKLARDSLELTRSAIRPFLSISASEDVAIDTGQDTVTLRFTTRNSGSLLARGAHTDIDFFGPDEQVEENNVSKKYGSLGKEQSQGVLVFPNNHYFTIFGLELNKKDDMELWNDIQSGKVKCRIRITYSSIDKQYVTIQTLEIAKVKGLKGLRLLASSPQKAD